ncbi:hypothetical protein IV38_GL000274 [Lactobacillus selangorensis]|uniref:UPF0223 protein IV38_GL000274 n=1 Tax=Lactobacillus selangorensis TaxID=81857 RepID=A0A0R2FMH0_9LACO|nr:UPF0223 family protein [Lactobacillus selangorensis]KRN29390.1 hypothetical protein IV38_GL000274 [Lactobacillus selangorensis]KRN34081.1 hypothetical protein IV40_GL000395 [Lactobacillus selangorensis]
MQENYQYPLNLEWTTAEMTTVIHFYNTVEKAYEGGATAQAILTAYRAFKKVVPSKMEERQLDRDFETVSDYSTYQAVKAARADSKGRVHLKVGEK